MKDTMKDISSLMKLNDKDFIERHLHDNEDFLMSCQNNASCSECPTKITSTNNLVMFDGKAYHGECYRLSAYFKLVAHAEKEEVIRYLDRLEKLF